MYEPCPPPPRGLLARFWFPLVTRLNEVRNDHTTYNNRLDTTLADVFNLLSLFFLTIGRTRECPATYSQIASMRVSHIHGGTHAGDSCLFLGWYRIF